LWRDAGDGPVAHEAPVSKSILVIEDDDLTRDALRLILEAQGYVVASADNGRTALEELRKCRPDLILLDLVMPVMNGWEFRAHLDEDPLLASIPVVVCSGAGEMCKRGLPHGTSDFLQKPFEFDALLRAVRKHCD
jgi:CheY-like chemotaxis protein